MQFDHDRLDVYRLAVDFAAWVGTSLDDARREARLGAVKQLDDASASIAIDIAEGSGLRALLDRLRWLDLARAAALRCAACLDVLVARHKLEPDQVADGKHMLVRIAAMLTRLQERLSEHSAHQSPSSSAL